MAINIPTIIKNKRDGHPLSEEEIKHFIESVVNQSIDDSQIGALLMAIYLKGLNSDETVHLTHSMTHSGEVITFPEEWTSLLVDKHSTGGVGDKISLVLAPALAALGFKVPMVSGRGLGITGGTLDKLESIKGFKTQLTTLEMANCLRNAGCFIAGASSTLAPADGVLYRIRDITSTVECDPLILSSILSKKVAEGTKTLVMDIKVGKAATIADEEKARQLATDMIKISKGLGVATKAVLSRMDTPLGRTTGNALEVWESIQCLRNEGHPDVVNLVTTLGAVILLEKGKCKTIEEGKEIVNEVLRNGKALSHFELMLQNQGVTKGLAEKLCRENSYYELPISCRSTTILAEKSGYISVIDALTIGTCCWALGAGRTKPSDQIDHSVGVQLVRFVGDQVTPEDPVMIVYHSSDLSDQLLEQLKSSIVISETEPLLADLIIDIL